MEWISVKDRLPERYHPILFVADDKEYGKVVRYGFFSGSEYTAFEALNTNFFYKASEVLFWVPMPEPPKEDA